jgi:hypothetical protein
MFLSSWKLLDYDYLVIWSFVILSLKCHPCNIFEKNKGIFSLILSDGQLNLFLINDRNDD